ncbi:MAG: zeta toxin family protein [Lachnospiraceae bacterium]|nr:zeta toxin family protein [Lachnospiraceae bacterium]
MAKLSETYKVPQITNTNGGGSSAPVSSGRKLSETYRIGENTYNAPTVSFAKEIPSLKPIQTVQEQPSFDYGSVIKEYESLPKTNILSRLFNKKSEEAYNRKQELNPLYEQAKDIQTVKKLNSLGALDDVKKLWDTYEGHDEVYTPLYDLLKSKGVTDKKELNDLVNNIEAMQKREGIERANKYLTEYADEHPILGSALTVPTKMVTGLGSVAETGINYVAGKPMSNASSVSLSGNKTANEMRNVVSDDMNGVGKFLYGSGMSMADMLANRWLLGPAGNLSMGFEKGADTMNEAIDQGLNPTQIVGKGLASGATTYITEKLLTSKALDEAQETILGMLKEGGLKALGKNGIVKVLLPLLVKSGASEGAQEGLEDVADTIADMFIAGGKNELTQSYNQYKANGLSDDEALKKVAGDKALELLEDTAGGFLSGFLMGGAEMGKSGMEYNLNNRNNIPTLEQQPKVTTQNAGEITNKNVNPANNTEQITSQNVNNNQPLVHTLTGAPVSEKYQSALDKLENGTMITPDEYHDIPEIQDAKSRVGVGDTSLINTPEREQLREEAFKTLLNQSGSAREVVGVDGKKHVVYDGVVNKDRRADIILGLPSSGKSTALVDPISHEYKSRLVDSDEAKKLLPEFDDGWGAGLVHEESKMLNTRLMSYAMDNGENIVLPKVGSEYDSIARIIKNLKREGYSVYVHFNDLDPAKAAGRNLRRFAKTGRFVDLDHTSFDYGNKPTGVFDQLVKEGDIDGYTKVSNDVPEGQYPRQLYGTEIISFDWRDADSGRQGHGRLPGQEIRTENAESSINSRTEVARPNRQRDTYMLEDEGLNEHGDEFYDRGGATLTENPNGGIPTIQRRNEYTSRSATNSFNNSGIFRQSEEYFNHMIERAENEELQVELKSMKKTNENTVEKLDKKGVNGVYKELMKKGVNTAEDVCASCYLMDYYIKNGDTVRADMVSRKVIDGLHNTGQTLQFMSAYTNTPAGMLQAMNALTGRETKLFIKEAKKAKLNTKKAEQFKQNGRLAAALKRIGYDGSMEGENTKTFQDILQEVKNTMSLESSSVQDDFTDADIEYLARLIEGGADVEELTNALTQHLVTGYFTISQEDIQKINELYNLADNASTSKERFEYRKQAAAIAAKYLGNSSFMDKWNSWRYLAMLGNPRTMIRNVLGNKAFGAITDIKDNVAAVLESAIIKDGDGRTKALLNNKKDADLLKASENDFEKYAYEHVAGSSKWTMKNTIENERQIFNNKLLEWARTKTSDKLESDDIKAIKRKYKRALAGYLKANGADASIFNTDSELLSKARDYAIEQAKIATFHEDNSLADILNRASNAMRERGDFVGKAAEIAIESTIPFKKTPLNILKQGVAEYSPASALKAVYHIATKADANVWINDISKALTGSTILMLGWILGRNGLLVGQRDDDEDDLYNKGSNYSLKVNGKSFTLDWLAPAALPLFVGSELAKEFEGESDKNILETLASIAEPAVEMSMLQGLDSVLSSLANTKGTKLAPTVSNIVSGYASQAVPTLFGQVARTIDPYRRSTRTNDSSYKNAAMATVEKTGEKILNKIPILSMLNQQYIDVWGNPQKNADGVPFAGGNVLGRAFQNFVSPGYFNDVSMTERESKLAELEKTYNSNGYEGTLIPSVAKSNKPNGDRMTNSEYESWSKTRGAELSKAVDTALRYQQKTTIPELQKYVKKIENFANFVAENKEFNKTVSDTYKKAYEAYKLGGYDGVMTYYMMDDQSDLDGNGSITHEELASWLRRSSIPTSKREEYFKIKFPKAKNIPSLK